MRYGFSTGALAKGDFHAALDMLAPHRLPAVEISALRMPELAKVLDAVSSLDLGAYEHVTVHAPSSFSRAEEPELVEALRCVEDRVEGFIVHAEAIHEPKAWRALGPKALIENADIRKRTGRTASQMIEILSHLPEARVCFDLAHVHQVDFSLVEARAMLRAFGDRIGQIHLSQLDHASRHEPLTYGVVDVFRRIAPELPSTTVILETCVPSAFIESQLELARIAMGESAVLDAAE